MVRTDVVQRLRIKYGVEEPLIYASVLDMGRLWERLLRRARIPVAYTQGFSPHPRLQFASALPVGYSSECELLDVLIAERLDLSDFLVATRSQAPIGLNIIYVEDQPLKAEIPQASMRAAQYRVRLWSPAAPSEIKGAFDGLLAKPSIIRRRMKKGRMADYDLRPLIEGIRYVSSEGDCHTLDMLLHNSPSGSGRPEEIIAETGLNVTHYAIHRVRLIWGGGEEITS